MDIRFWGVRGSLATPLSNEKLHEKLAAAIDMALKSDLKQGDDISAFIDGLQWKNKRTVGGDTSCIEVRAGETILVLDAGTGIRPLGQKLCQTIKEGPINANVLISHTHWDHISGIPFFAPAFRPGSRITFYIPEPRMEYSIRNQQDFEYFPVPLSPSFGFAQIPRGNPFYIDDIEIECIPLNHPGGSYGFRIKHEGKILVYATDSEYKDLSSDAVKPFTDFFQNADLLVFDAQYTISENIEKEDWGHSNIFTGIDMAIAAGVKNMVFTHHDPMSDDSVLADILYRAREYIKISQPDIDLRLFMAYEGLKMKI